MTGYAALALELIAFLLVSLLAPRECRSFAAEHKELLKFRLTAQAALYVMHAFRLADRFPESTGKVHALMVGLYGRKMALTHTKLFLTDLLGLQMAAVMAASLAAGASGDSLVLLYGCLLATGLPLFMYKELSQRLLRKKRRMLIELPEVLNRLVLLINAGETVQRALARCVDSASADGETAGPFIMELALAVREVNNNGSFPRALEELSKRCAVQEVSIFTTTLLLNYRRGGDDLVLALKELSVTLWEKRKSVARTLGEEASSKLVFPMVLIFVVVMVIVAAPAIFIMGN